MERIDTYERWLEKEGLPVIRDYSIPDLTAVLLKTWPRKGGLGAYIKLVGSEGSIDAYVCEIPPGSSLLPQRHLYEEVIYILSGYGATTVWVEGSVRQSFEWQEGSAFSPPLNTWHQHFNGHKDKPVRYIGVTRAPVFMNLFHDLDFIINNDYVFKRRYTAEEGYFGGQAKFLKDDVYAGPKVWESNFIPDCRTFQLLDEPEGGMGAMSAAYFELSNNTMAIHIAEEPVGSYKKAHYHGPGAHLICLSGHGYSLMWPADSGTMAGEGVKRVKVDWQKNSVFAPPDRWFHQHFNTGEDPARFLAIRAGGSRKYNGIRKEYGVRTSLKLGGSQIDYEDEDPEIRRLFKEELAKTGAPWRMSQYFPGE